MSEDIPSRSLVPSEDDEPFRPEWWTPFRRDIYRWLRPNAPELADLYASAIYLIFASQNFPGRIRLIAHAVREIRNRLPDAVAGATASGRTNHSTTIQAIKSAIGIATSDQGAASDPSVEPLTNVAISAEAYSLIVDLVQQDEAATGAKRRSAFRLFGALSKDPGDVLQPRVKQWLDVTEWFMQRAHVPHQEKSREQNHDDLQSNFEIFETTLGAMARGFYSTVSELDEILEDANS